MNVIPNNWATLLFMLPILPFVLLLYGMYVVFGFVLFSVEELIKPNK